jgi:hypothetical protein
MGVGECENAEIGFNLPPCFLSQGFRQIADIKTTLEIVVEHGHGIGTGRYETPNGFPGNFRRVTLSHWLTVAPNIFMSSTSWSSVLSWPKPPPRADLW